MKEQLKLLEELQRHDAALQRLDVERRSIPEKLESMRKDLATIESLLAREKAELEETERWRRDKDVELKTQEAQLAKTKQKLSGVKNSKEYMAAQREAETLRKLSSETTERLTELVGAADKAKQQIAAHQSQVDKLRELVDREAALAEGKLAEFDRETARLRSERDAEAKAIRPDVMKKYNAIKMKRGLAVVAVHNGTCRGCNMNIPPQLYNILQRGNSIEVCPTCNRVIYWDKLFEDPDGKPAEVEV